MSRGRMGDGKAGGSAFVPAQGRQFLCVRAQRVLCVA